MTPERNPDKKSPSDSIHCHHHDAISISKSYLNQMFSQPSKPEQEVFLACKKIADDGQAEAQFLVGLCYAEGRGTEQSYKLAFHYFNLAAGQGYGPAQYQLARCYREGKGVVASQEEELRFNLMAANQNYIPSLIEMGQFYWFKELETTVKYFKLALEQEGLDSFYDRKSLEYKLSYCEKKIIGDKKSEKVKAYRSKAQQVSITLALENIVYPDAQRLDISRYIPNRQLSVLRQIFEESKDKPIFLYASGFSYEEMNVVRDAMLENPKFTFICNPPDTYSLCEAFRRLGYWENCLRKCRIASHDSNEWYGFLFVG